MTTDWQQVLFDPNDDMIGRLDRLAKKRFWDDNIADEAFNWVVDKLKANHWKRLDRFKGNAKPSTYLHTVFVHSLESFSREKFGYPRPKTWLKNQGDFWVKIWKMLCLEREEAEHIKYSLGEENKSREAEIIKIIAIIKAKEPNCAKHETITSIGGTEESLNPDGELNDSSVSHMPTRGRATDTQIQLENYEHIVDVITQLCGFSCQLDSSDAIKHKPGNELEKKLHHFSQSLELQVSEQLLLQMKFQQSMSDSSIARALDLTNYQVKTKLTTVIARLSDLLNDADIIFE